MTENRDAGNVRTKADLKAIKFMKKLAKLDNDICTEGRTCDECPMKIIKSGCAMSAVRLALEGVQ